MIIRVPIPGFCVRDRAAWEPYVKEHGLETVDEKCFCYYSPEYQSYVIARETDPDGADDR